MNGDDGSDTAAKPSMVTDTILTFLAQDHVLVVPEFCVCGLFAPLLVPAGSGSGAPEKYSATWPTMHSRRAAQDQYLDI